MRNNIANDVKIENARQYPSKFNLSGSVSSTATLGEVGVCFSRTLQPGTKAMCGQEQLINMAPLVVPTYSKQWYKTWHYFCPVEDVWPNYTAFMTKTPISRNGQVFTPTKVPCIPHDILSFYVLIGAKCTLYFLERPENLPDDSWNIDFALNSDNWFNCPRSIAIAGAGAGTGGEFLQTLFNEALNGVYQGSASGTDQYLDVGVICNATVDSGNSHRFRIPVSNKHQYFFATDDVSSSTSAYSSYLADALGGLPDVGFCEGDYQLFRTITVNNKEFLVCYEFRLSNYGARIDKILSGLGYSVDFDDHSLVSVLPLLATYKSYWESFGLELWMNFETSYCGRLKTALTNTNSVNLYQANYSLFDEFMLNELGMMFVTEKTDYVSAHLPQPAVSVKNDTPLKGVIDVYRGSSASMATPGNHINSLDSSSKASIGPDGFANDTHAYTIRTEHGALDSEILKRMLKRTNANTALGKKLVALAKSQGLGKYLERTRTQYIGDTSVALDVKRVTAQANTYNSATGEGSELGSFSGQGVGYRSGDKKDGFQKLHYETDCFGYWICLDAITCESGYGQSEDITTRAVEMEQFYQPDYDDLGLQLDSKAIVNGSRDCSFRGFEKFKDEEFSMSSKALGFAPRFSEWKVGRNSVGGGFKRKSQRKNFTPYIMEKLVYPDLTAVVSTNKVSDEIVVPTGTTQLPGRCTRYAMRKSFDAANAPVAGNAYRYLGRYPWLGNLARIFSAVGNFSTFFSWIVNNPMWEYFYFQDDNYIILQEVWFKSWSNMLPIEETYGTVDHDRKELEYVDRV